MARSGLWGLARIVSLVTSVVVGLLVIGIVLVLLEANRGNEIVNALLDAARFLAGPFDNVFKLDGRQGQHRRQLGPGRGGLRAGRRPHCAPAAAVAPHDRARGVGGRPGSGGGRDQGPSPPAAVRPTPAAVRPTGLEAVDAVLDLLEEVVAVPAHVDQGGTALERALGGALELGALGLAASEEEAAPAVRSLRRRPGSCRRRPCARRGRTSAACSRRPRPASRSSWARPWRRRSRRRAR